MNEDKLYRKLKAKLGGHWTRIENTVTAGVPDCSVSLADNAWWLELKTLYRDTIYVRTLQRIWFMRENRESTRNGIVYWDDGPCFIPGLQLSQSQDFTVIKEGVLAYKINQFEDHIVAGWPDVHNLFLPAN